MTARPHLAAALDAVRLDPPRAFSWLGRREVAAPMGLPREATRALLASRLAARAYLDLYASGGVRPATRGAPTRDAALVHALREANACGDAWEPGWTVRGSRGADAVLEKAGVRVLAGPGDHRVEDGAARLRVPGGSLAASPGHFVAASSAGPPRGRPMRAYVHVAAAGAPTLVARLTSSLAGERFALKVAVDGGLATRRDGAVLYVEEDALGARWDAVADAARAAGALPGVPAFTLERAPGVGLARDPGNGESFGQHRARLVAEGLLRARRVRSRAAKLAEMEAAWRDAGVDVARPHEGP